MRPVAAAHLPTGFETNVTRRRRRLNSFRTPFRLEIARLTLNWPAVEDLADSFPALLFALATGYGTSPTREAAFHMVEMGQPLKEVAAVLGLPLWLRRVPAEALQQPLPALPLDSEFAAAILGRIPDDAMECTLWLDRLLAAYKLNGREFAVWAASEHRFMPPGTSEEEFQWLLAWGWASRSPRAPGHALLRIAWSPALGWKRAQDEISIWRKRINLVSALAGPPRDAWFFDGHALGYDIVQLNNVEDFIAESAAMENCLDQYATHLGYGRIRVFSVRRAGRPVADFELTLRADEITMPSISQVRGPRNRRAPPTVWQAIHAWLGAQPFRPLSPTPTSPAASRDALRDFWFPYLLAIQQAELADRLVNPMTGPAPRRTRPRSRTQAVTTAVREMLTTTDLQRMLEDDGGGNAT